MPLIILGVSSILYGIVVTWLSPRTLAGSTWSIRHPRVAIALWKSMVFTGALSLLIGVTTIAIQLGAPPPPPFPKPTFGIFDGVYLAIAVLAVVVIGRLIRNSRDAADMTVQNTIRSALSTRHDLGPNVGIFEAEAPVALALADSNHTIALSSKLVDALDTDALAAVVAHERAHQTAHHERTIRLSTLVHRWTPTWFRPSGAMLKSVRMLVELAADDIAVVNTSRGATIRALSTLAELSDDAGYRLRAQRLQSRMGMNISPIGVVATVLLPGVPVVLSLVAMITYYVTLF